jgi:hypothetical protein
MRRGANGSLLFIYIKKCIPLHQRPGDIFVPEFDNYGDDYLDVSVINITVKSHLGKSSKGLLMGADIRCVEKMKKYPDLGPRFKPLVID